MFRFSAFFMMTFQILNHSQQILLLYFPSQVTSAPLYNFITIAFLGLAGGSLHCYIHLRIYWVRFQKGKHKKIYS